MSFRLFSHLCIGGLLLGAVAGCSSDSDDSSGGGGIEGCDIVVAPSDDDTEALQTAFVEAQSDQTVCMKKGTYMIKDQLSVGATRGLTIRGVGESPDDVLLDFSGQVEGDDGMLATGDDITIENFSVRNTRGNGIVVSGATGVVFRKIKVVWDESKTENGAYAVYPTKAKDVLVEDCEVVGASDAGIYLGQSENAILRRNTAHGNVIGIEVENTTGAEIYENTTYDNTTGIFIPLLPNLQRKASELTIVRDNMIYENNRSNFGEKNTVVSFLPPGVGIILLNSDKVRVFGNTIKDQKSTAVGIVGQVTMDEVTGMVSMDTETDGYPEEIYIHDNTFENIGGMPAGILATLGVATLEEVVWDGSEKSPGSAKLCLGESPDQTFRDFGGLAGVGDPSKHSTDVGPHSCTLPDLDPITLP
ncbi:MAG: right-handed parallel beta-helix repeat-containing protein [Myxococcales bacterium]|nr:right-handed parallel beta-helix repeat-containing protein [Myxococcales bacterium]